MKRSDICFCPCGQRLRRNDGICTNCAVDASQPTDSADKSGKTKNSDAGNIKTAEEKIMKEKHPPDKGQERYEINIKAAHFKVENSLWRYCQCCFGGCDCGCINVCPVHGEREEA